MSHALIVGGTRGLGREVAKLLSAAGHTVSIIGRREPQTQDRDIPRTHFYLLGDIADTAVMTKVLGEAVTAHGPLYYLVFSQRFRGEGDSWTGELNVSLTSTKAVIEACADQFAPGVDKGIVVVSSVLGEYVGEGQGLSYHVGKAGLNQMMRFYAVNLGRKGIRVNAVTPFTFLKQESKDFYLNNKPLHDLYEKITPLGRMSTSEDSAKVIAFLCSPQAGFVNGQNIYVDGGLSLVWPETMARNMAGL